MITPVADIIIPETIHVPSKGESYRLSHTWMTSVAVDDSGVDARVGHADVPIRGTSLDVISLSQQSPLAAGFALAQCMQGRQVVPLWCDVAELEADAAADTRVLVCDTRWHRFHAGRRVYIFRRPDTGLAVIPIFAVVAAVNDDSIELTADIGQAFTAGDRVVPTLEVAPATDTQAETLRGFAEAQTIQLVEEAGLAQLPVTSPAGVTPNGFEEFEGICVFDWSQSTGPHGSSRFSLTADAETIGSGFVRTLISGTRCQETLQAAAANRLQAWQLMQFCDSRAGQTHRFWRPNIHERIAVQSAGAAGSGVLVPRHAAGPTSPAAPWMPAVAAIRRDGVQLSRVLTVENVDAATDRVRLAGSLASGWETLCAARLMRLSSDTHTEIWRKPHRMHIDLQIEEDEAEDVAEVVVYPPTTAGGASAYFVCSGGGDTCDNGTGCSLPINSVVRLIHTRFSYTGNCVPVERIYEGTFRPTEDCGVWSGQMETDNPFDPAGTRDTYEAEVRIAMFDGQLSWSITGFDISRTANNGGVFYEPAILNGRVLDQDSGLIKDNNGSHPSLGSVQSAECLSARSGVRGWDDCWLYSENNTLELTVAASG